MTNVDYVSELQFKKYWLLTAWASLVVIAVVSFVPVIAQIPISNFDKVIHALMYLVPTGIFCSVKGRGAFVGIFTGLVIFGAFIEMIQYWLPWRTGGWPDLVANTIGVSLGLVTAAQTRLLLKRIEIQLRRTQ